MLSQPMAGKTEDEIVATREKAVKALNSKGYEVVNTLFTDEWYSGKAMKERGVVQIPLCFLAKSLENMSLCHAAYFCNGWQSARGCRIEHDAAVAYGLDIIYEDDLALGKATHGELKSAAMPMLAFLNKYYHPHAYAVITEGNVEIVIGDMSVPLPVRD